jgi:hypothetical protein
MISKGTFLIQFIVPFGLSKEFSGDMDKVQCINSKPLTDSNKHPQHTVLNLISSIAVFCIPWIAFIIYKSICFENDNKA